jgi:hypothetical protein
MLIVHADVPPTDQDWARMLTVRNASTHKLRGILVVAPPRATINSAQRADVAKFMRETGKTIAVLTESALIRGVARAVGLLGVQVRAFGLGELGNALNYLLVPVARHDELIRRVEGMRAQLSPPARPPLP